MNHPDCSCCTSYPCEKAPDIFSNCWGFSLAEGMVAIAPHDWRPDWSKATPEGFVTLQLPVVQPDTLIPVVEIILK